MSVAFRGLRYQSDWLILDMVHLTFADALVPYFFALHYPAPSLHVPSSRASEAVVSGKAVRKCIKEIFVG